MPFKYQELMDKIEKEFKAADGDAGAWVVVLGCAPGSAKCPDGTQTKTPYALQGPVNYQETPDDTVSVNLGLLLQALKDKVKEIKALQVKAANEEKRNEEIALKRMALEGKTDSGKSGKVKADKETREKGSGKGKGRG